MGKHSKPEEPTTYSRGGVFARLATPIKPAKYKVEISKDSPVEIAPQILRDSSVMAQKEFREVLKCYYPNLWVAWEEPKRDPDTRVITSIKGYIQSQVTLGKGDAGTVTITRVEKEAEPVQGESKWAARIQWPVSGNQVVFAPDSKERLLQKIIQSFDAGGYALEWTRDTDEDKAEARNPATGRIDAHIHLYKVKPAQKKIKEELPVALYYTDQELFYSIPKHVRGAYFANAEDTDHIGIYIAYFTMQRWLGRQAAYLGQEGQSCLSQSEIASLIQKADEKTHLDKGFVWDYPDLAFALWIEVRGIQAYASGYTQGYKVTNS